MKHRGIPLISALLACMVAGGATIQDRADRAFSAREWASAQALYMLEADRTPAQARPYGRIVVAALMAGDTSCTISQIERAMAHGVPLDSVLSVVETESMTLGQGDMYAGELHRIENSLPYLRRPVQARLLNYYTFRNDPENIIRYSQLLLRGLPDSPRYLNSLAYGYTLAGDNAAAIATWEKTLKADPDNIEALVSLGNALFDIDQASALTYLRRAYSLRPSDYLLRLLNRVPKE